MSRANEFDVPRFATLFDCHKPVERYLRLTAAARAAPPPTRLDPIDSFLLYQMAALYPTEPGIIDLAADATGGASAAFWAAHPAVCGVRVGKAGQGGATEEGAAWRRAFVEVAARMGIPADACPFEEAGPGEKQGDEAPDPETPLFVTAAAPDTSPADVVRLLQRAVARYPAATVLLLGVGLAGQGPGLEGVVSFCSYGSPYRLLLARELSPFFAASRLAVVCPREDERADAVLRRIAGTFEGNFQFLSLVEAVVAAAQRPGPPEPGGGGAAALPAARRRERRADPAQYAGLVERIRQAVHEQLPPDAVVLSVSKGDEGLLDLGGRPVRHFPEAEGGGYAGFHPKDDAAAIEQLELQRIRGGQFLLFPATALWWLEHYGRFRRHLETNHRVAVCRPETCVVFDVSGAAPAPAPVSAEQADYARVVERVREAAARAVPSSATVAVVSKGDPNLVSLGGRRALHFPAGPGGAYVGHHPKDAAQALRFLASARAAGARYLLFPSTAFWWLDHYAGLRRYLESETRAVWSDDACRVFELPTNGRAHRTASKSARPRAAKKPADDRGRRAGRAGAPARNGRKKK